MPKEVRLEIFFTNNWHASLKKKKKEKKKKSWKETPEKKYMKYKFM